jgi:hypothetical protein
MWENFQQPGVVAWIILACGALGVLGALAAVVAVASRPRVALALGVAVTALGIAGAGLGAFGQMRGRQATDSQLDSEDLRPAQQQRLRRTGYLKARDGAAAGLLVAAVPLLAGVALMFAAARRRAEVEAPDRDPEIPFAPRPRLGVPVVSTLAAALSVGLALVTLAERVPGGNPSAVETARRVDADLARVQKAGDHDEMIAACDRLEDDLDARAGSFDPGLAPTLPAVARQCIEEHIQDAVARQSVYEIRSRLDAMKHSFFVERDPALRRLLQGTADEVSRLPTPSFNVND